MTMQRFATTAVLFLALLAPGMALDEPVAPPVAAESHTSSGSMLIVENAGRMFAASPQDGGWASGFNLPGTNGSVDALAVGTDGSVYAGGTFTTAGPILASYIARWDGSQWDSMNQGLSGGNPDDFGVRALVVGPEGSVYAAGNFRGAGGMTARNIARWDGNQWHSLGSGFSFGTVNALAFGPDGSLYAGGIFYEIYDPGNAEIINIARWDGADWYPLGSGLSEEVLSLAVGSDGSVYAGGKFTRAGEVAVNYIARWDGTEWLSLGSGMNGYVRALALGQDGMLYAGGNFSMAGEIMVNHIASWDGTRWLSLGGGTDYGVYALMADLDGRLYASGDFTTAGGMPANRIALWDGTVWYAVGGGMDYRVHSLVSDPDGTLYAGGRFATANGIPARRIARWHASQWHSLGGGNGTNWTVVALAVGPDAMFAGGGFTQAGGTIANYVATWDGSQWNSLGDGMDRGVNALAVGPDVSVYAGGEFAHAGGVVVNCIARWNGTAWHPLGNGMNGYVYALTVAPDGTLYAGGSFTTAGGITVNRIARWDGSDWHPLGDGMDGVVHVLKIATDGSLYAGGQFTMAGGSEANYIARWNGATWHPLGSGVNGIPNYNSPSVSALALGPDDTLCAGGIFTSAGEVPASNIACWDGVSWQALGAGMNGGVNDLVYGPDGALYVGGWFSTADGIPANHIARWDGAYWYPLAGGLSGDAGSTSVRALAIVHSELIFVGGRFNFADGIPSSNIALWGELSSSQVQLSEFDAAAAEPESQKDLVGIALGIAVSAFMLILLRFGRDVRSRRHADMTVQRWITIHALISALLVSQVGLVQPEFVTHQVPAGWTIETVDTHVIGSSLAVDGEGNPHVTYRDLLNDALKYAYRLGNDWQFEAVASGGIRTSSLALDQSDLPHIVYTTWDLERLRSTLRYMFKDNNGWHSETIRLYYQYIISYPSLSLGPGGVPCVVYYIPDTDPIDGGLMYAYRDAQGWHHEKVSPQQVSRAALDIDADGNPHIAYQSNFRLDHAYRDTGGWHSEVIDEGEVGGGVSLAYDDQDIPHAAYYNYSSASLDHAFKDGLGWHVETVTDAPREVPTP